MAFNTAETSRAAHIIQAWIQGHGAVGSASARSAAPTTVRDVALLSFPAPEGTAVADLILGLFLEQGPQRHWLALALKPPWTAVHWGEPRDFRNVEDPARVWTQAFGGAFQWDAFRKALLDKHLRGISVRAGDRVLDLQFNTGLQFTVELFGARPNWVLARGDDEILRWREGRGATASSPDRQKIAVDPFAMTADDQWFSCQRTRALVERRTAAALRAQTHALRDAKTELKDSEKLLLRLEKSLKEAQDAARCRSEGDELKANLYELKGKARVEATEKMTKLYARAKKLERTAIDLQPRVEALRDSVTRCRATIAALEAVDLKAPLTEVLAAVARIRPLPPGASAHSPPGTQPRLRKAEKKAQAQGLRRFTSKEGFTIWVGRNHAENEELVMKLARGNDLWLHLKGRPGAHVIVQVPAKKTASLETLLDAATLAAHYSGIRDGEKAEVDYAHRKNVKRRSGGGASRDGQFLVNYTGAKTLMVKVDPERIKKLMGSELGE